MSTKRTKPEMTWQDLGQHLDEISKEGNFHLDVTLNGTGAKASYAPGVAVVLRAREWTINGPGKVISIIQFHYPNRRYRSLVGAIYSEAIALSNRVDEKRETRLSATQNPLWGQ